MLYNVQSMYSCLKKKYLSYKIPFKRTRKGIYRVLLITLIGIFLSVITLYIINIPNDNIRQPILLKVPSGCYTMGITKEQALELCEECKNSFPKPQDCDSLYFLDETPLQVFYVKEFWIDDIEVTQAAYEKAVKKGICDPVKNIPDKGKNKPIVGVKWIDAQKYCKSIGKRLPTEVEWEKAARWDPETGKEYKYPWGNGHISCDKANYGRDSLFSQECIDVNRSLLVNVDAFPNSRSFIGAYNMVGNAWEFVADNYKNPYTPFDSIEILIPSHKKVVKGGGYGLHSIWVRPTDRYFVEESGSTIYVGFRCACDDSIPNLNN